MVLSSDGWVNIVFRVCITTLMYNPLAVGYLLSQLANLQHASFSLTSRSIMEFLDEEARPRFQFQSRPYSTPQSESQLRQDYHHKPTLFISLSLSCLLFSLSILYFQSEPFPSILFWFSLSLLVGPFAPFSLTGGDIRVGQGSPLQTPEPQILDPNLVDSIRKSSNRRSKVKRVDELVVDLIPGIVCNEGKNATKDRDLGNLGNREVVEEGEWTEADFELLKKQIVKYPVGMPGQWEAVAEAFSGRHKVENVVKMAKSMGERKASDSDSFSRFLKDRKPVDKRIDEAENGNGELRKENGGGGGGWSAAEDIALLNALKAFPKDVAMRWEKITAAVPGRSKAACMRRVADLKKDFRSSKASSDV